VDLEHFRLYQAKRLVEEANHSAAEDAYHALIELHRQIINSPDVEDSSIDDATILSYRYDEVELQMKQGTPKHALAEASAYSLYCKVKEVEGDSNGVETRRGFRQWCRTLRCQGVEKQWRVEMMYREIWFFAVTKEEKGWRVENGYEVSFLLLISMKFRRQKNDER